MYLLLAALGLLATFGVLFLTYFGVRTLVGRALRVHDRRLFGVYWDSTLGPALLLRAAALFSVCVVVWAVAVLGLLASGSEQPTTRVHVLPGPAAKAGMQDGDRVVAIDGNAVGDWDAVLAASRSKAAARTYTVERGNERLAIRAAPDEQGRVGIAPRYERQAYSLAEAAHEALVELVRWPLTLAQRASGARQGELMGPVGIVREVKGQTSRTSGFLRSLTIIASTALPGFVLLEIIDGLSLFGFMRSRPELRRAPSAEQEAWRLGRLRQVLLALTALLVAVALMGVGVGILSPGALPLSGVSQHWLLPSLLPVVFLVGTALRGRGLGALSAAALAVPCLGVAVLPYLIVASQRELEKRGFVSRWFRLEQRPVA
jgi:hypothetical protein